MSTGSKRLILASASPRRLELLRQIGIEPNEIIPTDIDETPRKRELPEAYVKRMAGEKYEAIRKSADEEAVILSADTIVACGRRILGKPQNEAEAREFLTLLSGRRHRVYSAICVNSKTKLVKTQVKFRKLSKAELTWYIETKEWQGKAGGYAIQGAAAAFIPWINGSYSNVVGLPLVEVRGLLSYFN
jgi:septum formation protein